jgi:hypothetical protein
MGFLKFSIRCPFWNHPVKILKVKIDIFIIIAYFKYVNIVYPTVYEAIEKTCRRETTEKGE